VSEITADQRSFIIIGREAKTSPDFLLEDMPSTSGRMDVLVHCVRAALLISHGVRRDTGVYLILLGPPKSPITVYFRGAEAKYVRPDERAIATIVRKALARPTIGNQLELIRNGVYIGAVGLSQVLEFVRKESTIYILEEEADDIRSVKRATTKSTYVIGDHKGFSEDEWQVLAKYSNQRLRVGPVSLQAEDVIAIVHNELDREQELGE